MAPKAKDSGSSEESIEQTAGSAEFPKNAVEVWESQKDKDTPVKPDEIMVLTRLLRPKWINMAELCG